jgi:hypothetical protein
VPARDGELVKRPSLGRPEEVAAPPHGSLPACALARAERAAIKWPCGGALSPRAHEERRRWGFFPRAGEDAKWLPYPRDGGKRDRVGPLHVLFFYHFSLIWGFR